MTQRPSSHGGPWPSVHVGRELAPAESEWLHTNGAGVYAMSTVATMHTRRQHGLLVAPLGAGGRHAVVLSHLDTRIDAGGKTYRLATHRFPGVAPTPGYRLLEQFAQEPLPTWTFSLGGERLVRTLCLARGRATLILGYRWEGRRPAVALLRPLLALRDVDALSREHGLMRQLVILRPGTVEIQPRDELPPVLFRHPGLFVGSPEWWRRFEYLGDGAGAAPCEEDLWTPGKFELRLEPGATVHLAVSVGDDCIVPPAALERESVAALRALDPGPSRPLTLRSLFIAADHHCALAAEPPRLLVSYPPGRERLADALMAVPGLLLARGLVDEAKRVLDAIAAHADAGWLPERVPGSSPQGVLAASDRSPEATLWLFEAARALLQWTGADDLFVRGRLYPALARAFAAVRDASRSGGAYLSDAGLLIATRGGTLAAPPGAPALACVEHQALWSRACATLETLAREYGDAALAEEAVSARARLREAFAARFWCAEKAYPFDSVSEQDGDAADASLRPNAVVALSLARDLFSAWQAEALLETARDSLLAPFGLSTLDPTDPLYAGGVAAPEVRVEASEQGASWLCLLEHYGRALLGLDPEDFEVQADLRDLVERAARSGGPVLGELPQHCDGDAPLRAGGPPASGPSVAALLWLLAGELGA